MEIWESSWQRYSLGMLGKQLEIQWDERDVRRMSDRDVHLGEKPDHNFLATVNLDFDLVRRL